MKSFRFCRLWQIDIKAHWTFAFLPLFFGFYYGAHYGIEVGLRAFSLIMLIFACVLGHELTHSVVARRYGIRVPEIVLYPMGGVASMDRVPRCPAQEFRIAVVGPFFNFALAGIFYFPFHHWLGPDLFSPSLASWPQTWANVFWANLVLGVFNLIPAFPMDGGRLLRSFLARTMDYARATQISANLGILFAILFSLFGIWKHQWMLVLVGAYVAMAAAEEKSRIR